MERIIFTHKATFGVAIMGTKREGTLLINSDIHFPMQSVFKFTIALVVLSEVDKGTLCLDQKIGIKESELLPDL